MSPASPSPVKRAPTSADWIPRIVEAVRRLKVKTVLLDGEGVVYDQHGMPSFDLIHSKQYDREVSLVAFDLLELDGDDVRRQPLLNRKSRLAKLIAKVRGGIEFAEHIGTSFSAGCFFSKDERKAHETCSCYRNCSTRRDAGVRGPSQETHAAAFSRLRPAAARLAL